MNLKKFLNNLTFHLFSTLKFFSFKNYLKVGKAAYDDRISSCTRKLFQNILQGWTRTSSQTGNYLNVMENIFWHQ